MPNKKEAVSTTEELLGEVYSSGSGGHPQMRRDGLRILSLSLGFLASQWRMSSPWPDAFGLTSP